MPVLGPIRLALTFSLSLSVIACGGGAGSTASASLGTMPALTGVVAVGAPLSQGQVQLRQADGTVTTVPLSPSGQWTLDLSQNLTLPVVFRANGWVGGESLELYSVLTENSSHVNLTPATDAIAQTVAGIGVLQSYMDNGGRAPAALTTQGISAAQTALRETLKPVLVKLSLPSTVNFFTDTMVADGTGLDALYDFVKFAHSETTKGMTARTIYDANWTAVDPAVTSDVLSLGANYDATLYTRISQLVNNFLALNQNGPLDFSAMSRLFHADFLENGYSKNRYLNTSNYRPRTSSSIDVVVTSCQTKIVGLVCAVKLGMQQGTEIRSWITQVVSSGAGLQFYGNQSGVVVPTVTGSAIGGALIYSVPKLYLTSTVMPSDKDTYIPGQFKLESNGFVNAVSASMSVKGRGNLTWLQPKKPWAIKFDTAQSLFGLTAAKNWVLLANYFDDDLMSNVSTMQVARMLDMSFVNTMNPVELWFNGEYQGFYLVTEKVEVNPGRVDLKAGYMLELSNEYDSSEKWRSTRFKNNQMDGLPIMIKDRGTGAKVKDISLTTIQSQFNALESAILAYQAPFSSGDRNALKQVLDLDSAAQYLAVNLIASNSEINHPKSINFYKDKNKSFYLGPPWDFDLAMRSDYRAPIDFDLSAQTSFNIPFFELIRKHPDVKSRMCDAFVKFKYNMAVMDEFLNIYAYAVQDAYVRNFNAWHSTGAPTLREQSVLTYLPKVKAYFRGRVDYLIGQYNCPL